MTYFGKSAILFQLFLKETVENILCKLFLWLEMFCLLQKIYRGWMEFMLIARQNLLPMAVWPSASQVQLLQALNSHEKFIQAAIAFFDGHIKLMYALCAKRICKSWLQKLLTLRFLCLRKLTGDLSEEVIVAVIIIIIITSFSTIRSCGWAATASSLPWDLKGSPPNSEFSVFRIIITMFLKTVSPVTKRYFLIFHNRYILQE